jgi:capsular exopolysaccharide synthesis family protein
VGRTWPARIGSRAEASAGSLGEAYDLVLGSLLLARNGKPLSVIAIISAQDGAGVTTTAINLGVAMARTGHKSLIVDANLRRPHLHEAFAAPQAPGLAEILAGNHKVADVIRSTSVRDLSLLTAGDPAVLPPTLLDPNRLAACARDLRARGSFVIFDVPSVLKYPDAVSVAQISDGIVLVVPAAGTSTKMLQEARRRLERADAKILGAVINRVPRRDIESLS